MNLSGCTIAFDLDGTLVDTAPDLHRALNHVMDSLGLPHTPLEDVRIFVGQGARALIVRACAVHGVTHGEEDLDRFTRAYVDEYAADIARHSQPYPGLLTALDQLSNAGARFVVCTNKLTSLSVQLLDTLGLSPRFAAIVGADAVERRKPHPDHYIAAIRAGGGDFSRSLMVGDSTNDVQSARAAAAPVIVYAHGYSEIAPAHLGADAVIDHYDELPMLAARLLNSKRPAG